MAGYYGEVSEHGQRLEGPTTPPPTSTRRDIASMTPQERFDYAKTYRIGFGQFKGMELTQIANVGKDDDERGLLYLDWLYRQDWLNEASRGAIDSFVNWGPVADDMNKVVERDAIKRGEKVN